jgi:hypothetical protein
LPNNDCDFQITMFFVSAARNPFYLLNSRIVLRLRAASPRAPRQAKKYGDSTTSRISRFPLGGGSGSSRVRVRLPLFVQEVLQYRFGIDPDEFFPQDAIQQVHVPGVDAVAVVHHGEVTDTR